MTIPEPLAHRLRRGDRLLGALLPMPNQPLLEHVGHAGFDFAVIDTEHGPGDQLPLMQHLTTADVFGLDTLVRVGAPHEALRALDLGASGIVAPHVSSVDDARAMVAAVQYPPLGNRGFATYTRTGRYGRSDAAEHLARTRDEVIVFAMIEDPAGVGAARAIAELEGISGLLVGPADLACVLGVPGRWDDPRVVAAIRSVRDDAHAVGGAVLSICADAATAREHFAAGSDAVVYNVQGALSTMFEGLARARPSGSRATFTATGRETLVLLPGMLGTAGTWDDVAGELIDDIHCRVARIDLDDSISDMADTVLADAPDRFALAGHSLGAIVALEVVRRTPHRVTRLALLNASAREGSEVQQAAWSQLLGRLDTEPFATVATELARANLPLHRRDDGDLVTRGERMAARVGADGLRRQLAAQSTRPDSRPHLHDIDVATLVVSGAEDQVCPPPLQAELAAGIPDATHLVLDAVGHMAPMEDPAAVAGALRDWLGIGGQ